MSLVNKDKSSRDEDFEAFHQNPKQSKILYSREFLLSLSELESCKTLPTCFDTSILSEFEDASYGIQDQQRTPGSLPFLSCRHSDYGSSPPSRGDSGNYYRSSYGRWDIRSCGHSGRDSDSQSNRDSDSGRRHGNPARHSWQSSGNDGLLGSGSFPRPSGHASGNSNQKASANDHYQLSRTNEPYHPPRPYKAVPHLRRGANDFYNDETFGQSDCTSEDRVEEERRRRASFEMMRKEQQRVLEENQKLKLEKQKVDSDSEISVLVENRKEENGSEVLDLSATPAVSTNDSGRSTIINQTSTTRPIVPPGFANTTPEKNTDIQSSNHTQETKVLKPEREESLLHVQPKPIHNGTLDSLERKTSQSTCFSDHQPEGKNIEAQYLDEKIMSFTQSLEVSDAKLVLEDHLSSEIDESLKEISAKVSGIKIQGESNRNHSTSILEKILSSALNVGDSMGSIERIDSKPDDTWTSDSVQSSKFAHWFSEEAAEEKPEGDHSFGRANDLLSLIVGGNKGRSQLSEEKAADHIPSEYSHGSSELAKNLMLNIPVTTNSVSQQLNDSSKTEAIQTVLTCEDLEQTILSEFTERSSNLLPSLDERGVSAKNPEKPSQQVDNNASQHLLLLLQKGTSFNLMASSLHVDVDSDKDVLDSEVRGTHGIIEEHKVRNAKSIYPSGKTLTLETLFGSAFMKELQTVETPVSLQRGPIESAQTNIMEPLGLSIPLIHDDHLSSTGNVTDRSSHQNCLFPLSDVRGTRMEKTENELGFENFGIGLNSSKHQTEVNSEHAGSNEAVHFQLPEEENLINHNDPLNPQYSMFMPAGTSKGGLSSSAPVDIMKKLAAIGTVVNEDRYLLSPEGSPFANTPYCRTELEIPHHSLHTQTSSPQFLSPQLSHGRPLFYPLDAPPTQMDSQMGPGSMIHQDPSSGHQFPASMGRFPFPRTGVTGYGFPAHHEMSSQMQISGNYTPHISHDLQRHAALPHPGNQVTSLMPELNHVQRFSLGPHHPTNIDGLGMPMPASDFSGGSNRPEAFHRILQMELRAKSKQLHPLYLGHSQGIHELDMGFRYK